jgi:hypothetical protein
MCYRVTFGYHFNMHRPTIDVCILGSSIPDASQTPHRIFNTFLSNTKRETFLTRSLTRTCRREETLAQNGFGRFFGGGGTAVLLPLKKVAMNELCAACNIARRHQRDRHTKWVCLRPKRRGIGILSGSATDQKASKTKRVCARVCVGMRKNARSVRVRWQPHLLAVRQIEGLWYLIWVGIPFIAVRIVRSVIVPRPA